MWRASILTLFPEMFPGPLGVSLAGKALASGAWALDVTDIRDFATDKHRSVDDTPAGGGPGMVMKADVLGRAIDATTQDTAQDSRPRLLMSPRGAPLTQARVEALTTGPGAVVVCARFEGVDERVIVARGLEEVSIGDYVLSGGEIAAMALIDACVRLLPGVIGAQASTAEESFRRRAFGISALYAAPALGGPADPGGAGLGRPRENRGLAPRRGRTADRRAPARPLGGVFTALPRRVANGVTIG